MSPTARYGHDGPRKTILVVDDEEDQREALVALLLSGGYEVVAVCDGQEAWEELGRGLRPTLIVLDLVMPRMDGWAFLGHLRRLRSGVPVLVTSASADERPPKGADAWLGKPYDVAQLRSIVARLSAAAS